MSSRFDALCDNDIATRIARCTRFVSGAHLPADSGPASLSNID
jgi:hypothetical protein